MKDLVWLVICGAFAVWFFAACFDQCTRREGFAGQENRHSRKQRVFDHGGRPPNPVIDASFASASAAPTRRAARPKTDDPYGLITAIGREFDVPAGALYGIWKIESAGLAGGWGQGKGWLSAADLSRPGSECYRNYKASRCEGWWASLQAICGQTRNGVRICDPNEVRTSYAFAMGPMQHLPSLFAPRGPDGTYRLGDHVVDYDHDGAADPHQLGDALASTAKLVRKFFEEEGNWQRAINRYYGSQTEGYYDGRADRLGVYDYWKQWCEMRGSCQGGAANYASK